MVLMKEMMKVDCSKYEHVSAVKKRKEEVFAEERHGNND